MLQTDRRFVSLGNQKLDKGKKGLGFNEYSAVPPPPAQVHSPPKKDLSWMGLPEFVDDTVTDYSRPTPSIDVSKDVSDEQKAIWKSNSASFSEQGGSVGNVVSKPMIRFVKETGCPSVSKVNNTKNSRKPTVKYAEMYRNTSQSPRVQYARTKFPIVGLKVPTAKPTVDAVKGNRGKAVKASTCIPKDNIDDKGYWDSGCSRHMTGASIYMSEYEPYNGGYVSFGHRGGKITGKGTIKTGKIEFENVYFMKELKYNLFSVSQICDNKNSVLFTDSECLVLGKEFKLVDDTHVLLRTPRQQNMYSIDLKNIVPHKNLTCLIAKASVDECMLWHRRCDNGGEFRNKEMDEFYSRKCIKREFSNARTPQQNDVAERRNRTLIEAARTMLADAKLPVTFWAEAVNTACYVEHAMISHPQYQQTFSYLTQYPKSMAKLSFCDYHNMVAILEKTEHNTDFYQIVDFLEASHIRIETSDGGTKIIAKVDGKQRTISESSIRRHLKLNDEEGISTFPDTDLFENLSLMGYNILPNQSPKSTGFNEFSSNITTAIVCLATNRVYNFSKMILDDPIPQTTTTPAQADTPSPRILTKRTIWIAQSKVLSPGADEPVSLPRDDRHGEAFPTASSLDAGQDRENIAQTFAIPHKVSPRVTSLGGGEGNLEITQLKTRVQTLEDNEQRRERQDQEDAPNIGGVDQGEDLVEKSTDKGSEDTVEVEHVLNTMEAANVLSSGGAASTHAEIAIIAFVTPVATAGVATVSGSVPTASAIFTTISVVTPYSRRTRVSKGIIIEPSHPSHTTSVPTVSTKGKGKEKVVESTGIKKKKIQEKLDAQVARELVKSLLREEQVFKVQAEKDDEICRDF
ncbi:ribonuclease H-like domain-containing protein [Tanacetum coccineum]|uniref:Ribonuclease H-like domain-containing protein n=1 Tax=Tanacetum coccineum TaxID=301880 RepID=A0ABQ5D0G4_9ASTR